MRASIPDYVKPVASDGTELVMSTPTWYGKRDAQTHATLLVDLSRWPPQIAKHALETVAAARCPDGRWACVARSTGAWHLAWFADVHATAPVRRDELPFALDPAEDDGPVAQLLVLAGTLLAVLRDGSVHASDGERWQQVLRRDGYQEARVVRYLDGEALEWDGALVDARFQAIDARGCRRFVRVGDAVFGLRGSQLVEVTADDHVPRLAGHEIDTLEAGPGGTLAIAISRDDERGTARNHALYDPRTDVVTYLPESLVGNYPNIVACTGDHALVLHDDKAHALVPVSADELGTLEPCAASTLPIAPAIDLAVFDDVGAASRPLVATTGSAIVIALRTKLRFHTVDQPTAVIEHALPIVAVCAARARFAALDTAGVLHAYGSDGALLGSRPVVDAPRSLGTLADRWVAVGQDRIVIVDDRMQTIEIAGPIAVAEDPGGELVIACEEHRLALWTGTELRDLPPTIEQIVAVAALGERMFACLGRRGLYLLDLAHPELVSLEQRLRRPHLASIPIEGRLARCSSPAAVGTQDLAGDQLVSVAKGSVHYSTYSEPRDEYVTVHGLAFMDDGRLVVLLDEGRANIVAPETGTALKLDPQPEDAPSRWIFICGGQILIAE